MLFLLFRAGDKTFALEAGRVQEIVPDVQLEPHPGAPDYLAGLFNYRGLVTPVIEFNRLVNALPSPARWSRRILLTPYSPAPTQATRLVGFRVEALTETMERNDRDFSQTGVGSASTPFLGGIFCEKNRLVQRILLEKLLPAEANAMLFPKAEHG
jgi:chemotaxis-related protein WspB